MRSKRRKTSILIIVSFLILTNVSVVPAKSENVTWSQISKYDSAINAKNYNSQYDLEYSSAYIFNNDNDLIYFYLDFKEVPRIDMFKDGLGSFAYIGLDYDLDKKDDMGLYVYDTTLTVDRSTVKKYALDMRTEKFTNCEISIFTNIAENDKWIGIKVSRSCIKLPNTFDMWGYSQYKGQSDDSWDFAPDTRMRVALPGVNGSSGSASENSAVGSTYSLPETVANSSKGVLNFSEPPKDLANLSSELLPSVVTVKCAGGSGTGWSAELLLSAPLVTSGYRSIVVTNHHVIENCLFSKDVMLVLSNGASVPGKIISWNASNDVAGIATSTLIPSLQWIGSLPKQGWWIGVLGSPLGKANVLTTGIISSVNLLAKTFTLTAPINPGNSGGPVFDSTGRVLGLATSKNLLSSGQLAEGFGNAHGVPLLCSTIISCLAEKDPWSGIPKFAAISAEEAESKAKAEAEAKAKAEAEARVRAEAEAKAKVEAELAAKLQEEMRGRCVEFNGKLELELFNLKSASITYPSSSSVFTEIVSIAPAKIDCDRIDVKIFNSELQNNERILEAFKGSIVSAIATAKTKATSKKSITCIKGNLIRKVTALNPKCPKGYRKK